MLYALLVKSIKDWSAAFDTLRYSRFAFLSHLAALDHTVPAVIGRQETMVEGEIEPGVGNKVGESSDIADGLR